MKTIHIFYSLALVSLLCACSAEQDAADAIPATEPQPVTVAQVSVVGEVGNVGDAPATRAAVSDATYQLGVIRDDVAPYTAVWNTPYSYVSSGASSVWTSTTPIAVDHREATFYAYYPYHTAVGNYANLASGYEFTLSAQAYSASEDICISADAQKVTNNVAAAPSISFTDMPHVYSRIRLTLTRGAANESTGTYAITNINFKNGSQFATTATQNIKTRAVPTPTYTYTGWNHNPHITLSAGATAQVIDLLVPPQPVNLGLSMMFTIDGHMRSVTIPADKFTDNKLVAGEQYSIALTLRDVAVTMIGTVETGDWTNTSINENPNGYEDDVLPYVILPGFNLKVAKGNLMRASGTGHWYLAPDQGYYTYAVDGGDYYSWDVPTLNDGCVAVLGNGWRVPSKADNEKLAGLTNCWGAYDSQRGTSNGQYFGTSRVPGVAHQDDYVFFPAAGCRYTFLGKIEMIKANEARYWSSEPSSNSGSAYIFYCYDGGISTEFESSFAFDAYPVRCVADN